MNLDDKTIKVKRDGWSAEDRTKELLDLINTKCGQEKPWLYTDLLTRTHPSEKSVTFVEGFVLACAWLSGSVTSGKLRQVALEQDNDNSEICAINLQRLIEHAEHEFRKEEQ